MLLHQLNKIHQYFLYNNLSKTKIMYKDTLIIEEQLKGNLYLFKFKMNNKWKFKAIVIKTKHLMMRKISKKLN